MSSEVTSGPTHDYAGNYLEWRLGERSNTFVDDRPGAETFLAYGAMLKLKSGWQDVLAEVNPDVILWKHKEEFAGELRGSKDWFLRREGRRLGSVLCQGPCGFVCSELEARTVGRV